MTQIVQKKVKTQGVERFGPGHVATLSTHRQNVATLLTLHDIYIYIYMYTHSIYAKASPYVCTYIYIYGVRPLWCLHFDQNFPRFYSKENHKSQTLVATIHVSAGSAGFVREHSRSFFQQRERQIRAITLTLTMHYLNSRANGSLITPITFTYSLQSYE